MRGFIDFVNRQVGVYCDCLAGFQGNKTRIERQIHRAQRPVSRQIKDGQQVIVWASVEDPSRPDVLHHRIIRAEEFLTANSEAGFNEQQICWAIVVFIFSYWDEEIRPQIARVRGVRPNDVRVNVMGDLRILRGAIVHNGGILSASDHAKLLVMKELFEADQKLAPTHDQMHKLFVLVKQAIGALILEYSGHLPGAPIPAEITDVAIQSKTR